MSRLPTFKRALFGSPKVLVARLATAIATAILLLGSLGTVIALDQPAQPGGAPDPRPGPFKPDGFVRIVDGDTLEVVIDERRVGVAILGITAPTFGTPCGTAARAELTSLVGRGVLLEDVPGSLLDARKRRLYRATTPDGRSVALAMVSAGLARADGTGPEAAALATAEAKARQEKAGCVWGGPLPAPRSGGGAASMAGGGGAAVTLPSGFTDETVVSGLNFPTAYVNLPDGRMLVSEKAGVVRLVAANGTVQTTPVLDIHERVNNYWDRGMVGITIDPNFASNKIFYVFYVYEPNAADPAGPKSGQLVKFILRPDNTADPNAGTVILGTQTGQGCPAPPSQADCLPGEDWSHSGGTLRFAPDGTLFVSTGDAASFTVVDSKALRSQSLDSLAGKILRINTNGQGLSSNPFWNGNANAPQSKVWARGFRNPFRATLRPGTSMPYVGDVGWSTWEEVSVIPAGANAGWPCYEGNHQQAGYATDAVCQALYSQGASAVRMPFVEWGHDGSSAAALAGAFYTGSALPPSYQGAFFYADHAQGWIRSIKMDSTDKPISSPSMFASGIPGPVQIEISSDGSIYYLIYGTGEIHRIRFVGSYTPLNCPLEQFRAEYYSPNNESLSGIPAFQECVSSIDYTWPGSPGNGIEQDHFSARWTGRFTFSAGTYQFQTISDDGSRLWVDDELLIDDWANGAANPLTANKTLTAGQHNVTVEFYDWCCDARMKLSWQAQNPNPNPPTATITAPANGTKFKVGDVVNLSGSGSDQQDGALADDKLRWDVLLKHCPGFGPTCHDHSLVSINGKTGQFTVPDHGDGSYFEIRLTATDSGGLTGSSSVQMDPKTLQVTLATNPTGGTVLLDGSAHTAPYSSQTIAGSTHTISVQPGANQQFVSWSQGGAQQQNVTVGETNVTYTANLGPVSAGCTNPQFTQVTPSSPRPAGTSVSATVSATASGGATCEYRFWRMDPNGAWTMVRDWSTGTSYTYAPLGTTAGAYKLGVWTRPQGVDPPQGYTTTSGTTLMVDYTLTAPGTCTNPQFTQVSPATPQTANTNVSVTASATASNGATCEFRFWKQDASGNWSIVRDWGTGTSYTYAPLGTTPGAYKLGVWTRVQGVDAPQGYSTNTNNTLMLDYTLTAGTCTNPQFTQVNPSSPRAVGTNVSATVSATASSGTTCEYRFWRLDPSGTWTMVRDWSTNTTYTYTPLGNTAGAYQLGVWTRPQGSDPPQGYSTNTGNTATVNYTLTAAGCSAPQFTQVSPASPQATGANVAATVSATATGGVTCEYRFWRLDPSGTWTMVRDWSTSTTYTYTPLGNTAGAYQLGVWTRPQGSDPPQGYSTNTGNTATVSYTLTAASCTNPQFTQVNPGSPRQVGTNVAVTVSATSSGGATCEYRLWRQDANGTWTMVRDWSTSTTYTYAPLGTTPGAYKLGVWTRVQGVDPPQGYSTNTNNTLMLDYTLTP